MPTLKLFNRRWRIASDDFFAPGIVALCLRLVWSAVLVAGIVYYNHLGCDLARHLIYLWGCLFICVLVALVSVAMINISTKGLIMQTRKRRAIKPVLYSFIALTACEAVWTVFGTYAVVGNLDICEDLPMTILMHAAVLWSWAVLLVIVIMSTCIFDPFSHVRHGDLLSLRESWEQAFKVVFCCVNTQRSPYEDIAELFAQMFSNLDFAPSDVVAGLIILREQHKLLYGKRGTNYNQETRHSRNVDINDDNDCLTVLRMHHFAKYALGSYGWPLFMFTDLKCGLCKLGCCEYYCCSHPQGNKVHNDNCMGCNYAATKRIAGLREEDILYYNMHNGVYESPFYVAFDHHQQAVVLCIRGSMSLEDVLTDLEAGARAVAWVDGGYAHGGMLRGAQYLLDDLETAGVLEDAFARHPQYQLVVVGHSLGAGLATLVSIHLRRRFPTLQCFAFSPPGGLVSHSLAEYCRPFVLSIVVGRDIVPRASIATMLRFRDELVLALETCPYPKYKVLGRGIRNILVEGVESEQSLLGAYALNGDLESGPSTLGLTHTPRDDTESLDPPAPGPIALDDCGVRYMAGRVMHIVKDRKEVDDQSGCCFSSYRRVYRPCWALAEDFDRIIVSPLMITDHFPDHVVAVLDSVATDIALANGSTLPPRDPHPIETAPVGFQC